MKNTKYITFICILFLLAAIAIFHISTINTPKHRPTQTKENNRETVNNEDNVDNEEYNMYKKLTTEEENVIVKKNTEPPFTGKYDKFMDAGTYTCKRCGSELFESSSKFDSGCGWPSFDDQIPAAVTSQLDPDGRRVEITCAKCGAHLGHIFKGEQLTPKNTRYCVNSISMNFIPAATEKNKTEIAIFAGGCFWGTQYYFENATGVISAIAGYTGGNTENPTYEQVCTGNTGHAEAIQVTFDPQKTSYEDLAKLFFEIHDFTQLNRQGPDVGTQYRSAVYYLNDDQKYTIIKLINILKEKNYAVKTVIEPAKKFYPAEIYHQNYYQKTGKTQYCHAYKKIF